MTEERIKSDNPNILTQQDIEEFGIEEAAEDMGPSLDEIEHALAIRKQQNGKIEETGTAG